MTLMPCSQPTEQLPTSPAHRAANILLFAAAIWVGGLAVRPCHSAPVTLAVIGDYGIGSVAEQRVANMIKTWQPAAILTTGDNNYPNGSAQTIDGHIGQYYHEFIGNYQGSFGAGSIGGNRFFPSLGNHDWRNPNAQAYLDYFSLPGEGFQNSSGNERYYDFRLGNAHFFAYDSDPFEPDGVRQGSVQAEWLRSQLAASDATWKIVYFHHPPFSSGLHGSNPVMQLPFKAWGADAVLSGHDHTYERVIFDGFPYFVTGTGGAGLYYFNDPICGSRTRFNDAHGALRITIDGEQALYEFLSIDDGANGYNGGRLIDRYLVDTQHPAIDPIPGDGDQNGDVDIADLNAIRNGFGSQTGGDANHDCQVSIADLNWVRNNFGGQGTGDTNQDGRINVIDLNAARNSMGSNIRGDVNRDGVIDVVDLNLLRNNFGSRAEPSSVPEPPALTLSVLTVFLLLCGYVKRDGQKLRSAAQR